jgi:predicted metal-dependent phosphoesterase TrpH
MAVRAGLDGLVITEHHYQWPQEDLDALVAKANTPGFLLLAGFEYSSNHGDILIYGLQPIQAEEFTPGMAPEEAVRLARSLGAAIVAAHPTRAGMGYDDRIATLGFDAMEVRSLNLKEHEQRLAAALAATIGCTPIAASDAHQIYDVGRYATDFLDPIRRMSDLRDALKRGRFQMVDTVPQRYAAL